MPSKPRKDHKHNNKQKRTRSSIEDRTRKMDSESVSTMLLTQLHRHPGFSTWHPYSQRHRTLLGKTYHSVMYEKFLSRLTPVQLEIEMEARIYCLLAIKDFKGLPELKTNQLDLMNISIGQLDDHITFNKNGKTVYAKRIVGGFYLLTHNDIHLYVDADELVLMILFAFGEIDDIPEHLKYRIRV